VLISAEGRVYLADYGVVAPVEHVTGSSSNGGPERELVRRRHAAVVSTFTGTPAWMAPEVCPGPAYTNGIRLHVQAWFAMLPSLCWCLDAIRSVSSAGGGPKREWIR
jgi:serine/threonine protein kinase